MDAYEILVIILGAALAVFLVLAIVVAALIIKILKNLRAITEKAEHVADNIDSVSEFFRKTAGPAAIGKLIVNIVDSVRTNKKSGKD